MRNNFSTMELYSKVSKESDQIRRDLKISIINNTINLPEPSLKRLKKGNNLLFNKSYWKIFEKFKDNIITGSSSLKIFGLISREIEDVDLILLNEDKSFISKLSSDRYRGMDDPENMWGYTTMRAGSNLYYVDFFKNQNTDYIDVDGFKVQNPIEVICRKLNQHRSKDILDAGNSLNNLNYFV